MIMLSFSTHCPAVSCCLCFTVDCIVIILQILPCISNDLFMPFSCKTHCWWCVCVCVCGRNLKCRWSHEVYYIYIYRFICIWGGFCLGHRELTCNFCSMLRSRQPLFALQHICISSKQHTLRAIEIYETKQENAFYTHANLHFADTKQNTHNILHTFFQPLRISIGCVRRECMIARVCVS